MRKQAATSSNLGFREQVARLISRPQGESPKMPCMALQLRAGICRPPASATTVPHPQQPSASLCRQAVHCQATGSTVSTKSQQGAVSKAVPATTAGQAMFPAFVATYYLNTVGVQVEREEVPHYAEGAEYLRSLGFRNASEISRVLDIAMNPNSLYLKDRHKRRSVNSSVGIG